MQPDRHIVTAKVANIKQETASTKSFDLIPCEGKIDFLPGQWIDLFVSLHGRETSSWLFNHINPMQHTIHFFSRKKHRG